MESLVKLYERPVYNAAYRMLGNRDDAADATQTTFLKAFQHIERFNPAFKFFSWIYRIAMNESINMLKRRPASEMLDEGRVAGGATPDDALEDVQLSAELQSVLTELSDDYRSVIVLKYFTGCSYDEMADILRIPVKTVKSRLFTARRRMKEALERHGVTLS